jgi:F0F1-type ATP synthase epsilon subunit
MKLKLTIVDLDGVYFQGEVDLLNITVASGTITILAR